MIYTRPDSRFTLSTCPAERVSLSIYIYLYKRLKNLRQRFHQSDSCIYIIQTGYRNRYDPLLGSKSRNRRKEKEKAKQQAKESVDSSAIYYMYSLINIILFTRTNSKTLFKTVAKSYVHWHKGRYIYFCLPETDPYTVTRVDSFESSDKNDSAVNEK